MQPPAEGLRDAVRRVGLIALQALDGQRDEAGLLPGIIGPALELDPRVAQLQQARPP